MKWYWILFGVIVIAFVLLRCTKKELLIYPFKRANLLPDAKEFIEMLNVYRNENGCSWLQVDNNASMLEFTHVLHMMDKQEASHDNLDYRRSELVLEGAENVNEIVAIEYCNVETALKALKDSPEHNKAMLDTNINTCGISIRNDIDGKKYIAVIFFNI